MSRTTFVDRAVPIRATLLGALLALAVLPALASAQSVDEKYQRERNRNSKFNLGASATTVLRVNQYQCGLANDGGSCLDTFSSPTGGGSFWPTGSPNQYMFRSGIQVLGIVPKAANCNLTGAARETSVLPECFAWSGDTTAALFNEGTGSRLHGQAVSDIYDSLNPDDLANWPTQGTFPDFPFASAMVEDTALFNDVLIGRKAASQQDTWVLYWDGDPARAGGRVHPLGVLVEQRTLAWNYPEGNEATVYMIYKVTNVTNNPRFQRLNEDRFFGGADKLPNAGWRLDSLYMAYDSDPDVTHDFQLNYATAIFPFNVGFSYDGSMYEPTNTYPPSLFHAPFFTDAPGLVAIKYLQSPVNPATGREFGLTSFSLHTNGGAFPDPSTVQRAWRYVALNVDPSKGDPNCTFPLNEIKARRSCYLAQTTADVRFWVGSGPFSLRPGESTTIAVAQYAAATVATPTITRGPNERNVPGLPSLAPGCNNEPIRPIEIGSGYIGPKPGACAALVGGALGQFDVNVVKNSLLGRALVAQSIYDNKFLLGFAPETPPFYLVPGDNRITVVWEPSATDQAGDPFAVAASNPNSPLFDPNYRKFDVEGYRIYRGTSPGALSLVAQFDKTGTTFVDRTCVTEADFVPGDTCGRVHEIDITGEFVQFTSIARLQSGDPIVLAADTALAGLVSAGNSLPLSNTGVPYAYVDVGVRNGFQYFYKVTAFDINSISSGPSSLESAGPAKSTWPRAPATSLTEASFAAGVFGRGTTPLNTTHPTINPTTGTFSGPAAVTEAFGGQFAAFASQLLPKGVSEIRIDSVKGCPAITSTTPCGYYPNGVVATYFITGGGQRYQIVFTNSGTNAGEPIQRYELQVVSIPSDPTLRAELRAKGVDAPPIAGSLSGFIFTDRPQWHSGDAKWAPNNPGFWIAAAQPPAGATVGGSRWFTGANETTAEPTDLGPLGPEAGAIQGYTVFKPNPYMTVNTLATYSMFGYGSIDHTLFRRLYGTTFGFRRAADVKFFWGAAGLDSVIDVTHNVPVLFKPDVQASYGFLTDADGDGVLTHGDFLYIPGLQNTGNIQNYSINRPRPLVAQPVVMPTSTDGNLGADGQGFGLYINGEPYLFGGARPTNTVWTLRTYNGAVTKTNGVYAFQRTPGTPAVPGLRILLNVESPSTIVAEEADLSKVHTVPDPYYATSLFDLGPSTKELQFVNMPAKATIRIYSLSGVLVDVVNHDDPSGGGRATWDLRNRSNQFVASGVYLFHLSTPEGKSTVGKFTVVNAGFAR